MWLKVSSKDNKPSLMLLGPGLHTSPSLDTISRYSCRVGFDFPFLRQNLKLPSRLLPLLGGLLFWQREVVRPSTSTIAHFELSSESCTVNKRAAHNFSHAHANRTHRGRPYTSIPPPGGGAPCPCCRLRACINAVPALHARKAGYTPVRRF